MALNQGLLSLQACEKDTKKSPSKMREEFDNIGALRNNSEGDAIDEEVAHQVSQIFFFLGITYRQLNMLDDAVLAYQNAIELNYYYSDCYYNLGNIYFEMGDHDKAELAYKSALESLEEERTKQMY